MRPILFLLFFVGILLYVGYLSFNKVVDLALANSSVNYYTDSKKEEETEVVVIGSCEGKFKFSPRNSIVPPSSEIMMINSDNTPHTIGFAYTNFWESIPPGGSLVIKMDYLKESTQVQITCDGLLLDNPPTIVRNDLK